MIVAYALAGALVVIECAAIGAQLLIRLFGRVA